MTRNINQKVKIGRNSPCWCGSGKKFKRCHGFNSSHRNRSETAKVPPSILLDPNEQLKIQRTQNTTAEFQRKKQQGLGKPIISTIFKNQRVVAVGNKVFHSDKWKTHHDFLLDYIKSVFGLDWGRNELQKPFEERHPILQWNYFLSKTQAEEKKKHGTVHSVDMSGAIAAYLHLAYDLYLIAHNEELQTKLVERLKDVNNFVGALYEVRVAAAMVRSGFSLEFENEEDGSTTHCEFTATCNASGKKYSVEAKGHDPDPNRGSSKFRWGKRLQDALSKRAEHPRVVFLDANAPDNTSEDRGPLLLKAALKRVRSFEGKELNGNSLPPAYVFITNFPYQHHLEETQFRTMVLADGFQIPEFKEDTQFPSFHDLVLARESHADMHQLLNGFREYLNIPITFDGEIPEFAKEKQLNRLVIGQWYLIPDANGNEVAGKLQDATVIESERVAHGIFITENGKQYIVKCPLTDSEIRAYRQHPDTFFGQLKEVSRKINHELDAYDWLLSIYQNSPKENLIKLLSGKCNENLESKTQEELAKL